MRIALVNMPFAALHTPSLALTQLQGVLRNQVGDHVRVDVHYLNQDFGRFFGPTLYQELALGMDHLYAGLGDWLFRHVAFPDAADNSSEYFRRFYPRPDTRTFAFRSEIRRKRDELDAFLESLITDHELLAADLVGFTSMFAQSVACLALARKIKQHRPGIVTVVGGANCEGVMGRAIASNVADVDFVFSGPGLIGFPELVRRLGETVAVATPIAGVYPCRLSPIAERIVSAPDAEIGQEMPIDDLVPLDYEPFLDSLERQFPGGAVKPVLHFETSRGCWWGAKAHCTFCGLNGSTMRYRSMSPDRALEQFRSLLRYAPRCTKLNCVDNILPKSYLREVLPRLEVPLGFTIFYEVKADLSEDDVRVLAKAGVRSVQPGIESLATSTLKLMRKGTSVFTNLQLLINCRQFDVIPVWNLLMGFPGEEEPVFEKYLADIPLLHHFTPPTGAFPVRFDRFSPYFEQHAAFDLDLAPLEMYTYVFPYEAAVLTELAYYFSDRNVDAAYQVAMRNKLPEVQRAIAAWRHRYSGWDGGLPAELFLSSRDGEAFVHDSRTGELVEHRLTDRRASLLMRLGKPTNRRELEEAESDLEWLVERRFLFEEHERVISLVLPRIPPRAITASSNWPAPVGSRRPMSPPSRS